MSQPDPNEAMPIVNYMAGEMNRNAAGEDAIRIKQLNEYSATTCIAEWQRLPLLRRLLSANMPQQCVEQEMSSHDAAILSWALLVRQNGPWDHKPYILRTFQPRHQGEQLWHRLGNWEYFFDIWSNIHYGYLGRACAFPASTLLNGAGMEQMGSDVFGGRMPQHHPGTPGFAGFDDPGDQAAIQLGIMLFASTPSGLTSTRLRAAVENVAGLTRRRLALGQAAQ